jgi:hypothetical protein
MKRYDNIHPRIEHCIDCKQVITQMYLAKEGRCRHCNVKNTYGTVDIKTCFQGSVITLED